MSQHKTTLHGQPEAWQMHCSCRAKSPVHTERWDAELWRDEHLLFVERVKAHRSTRNPSLADQAAWYRDKQAQASDPDEVALWDHLADELEHRLGTAHPIETPPLF